MLVSLLCKDLQNGGEGRSIFCPYIAAFCVCMCVCVCLLQCVCLSLVFVSVCVRLCGCVCSVQWILKSTKRLVHLAIRNPSGRIGTKRLCRSVSCFIQRSYIFFHPPLLPPPGSFHGCQAQKDVLCHCDVTHPHGAQLKLSVLLCFSNRLLCMLCRH